MIIDLATTDCTEVECDWLIAGVPQKGSAPGLESLERVLGGALGRLREWKDLPGKTAETLVLHAPETLRARRLLLVGLGAAERLSEGGLFKSMMSAARAASGKAAQRVAVVVPPGSPNGLSAARAAQVCATALAVGSTGQDLFKSERKRFPFERALMLVDRTAEQSLLRGAVDAGLVIAESINLAREQVNLPAQRIDPESFAARAAELAAQYGLRCDLLDQPALEREKMGSLLAVAAGSDRPPRVVVLEYNNAPLAAAPQLALVGKGVTFDSGGLSIKNTENMLSMKCDMAGAATVLASLVAIARLKLPLRVMGLLGLVENMTGGSAMKLGDVLFSRAGVTIEVQNTDAEGRLVLADLLDYAVTSKAERIIDLATLTGACVVALGEEVAGAMTNNQAWCNALLRAAAAVGEEVWQLPMFEHYNELINSDVADLRNVGGRWGGAITAAKFLERFVKEKPWVHLDIAGPAFASADKPHREGGATGVMVRTLVELAQRMPHA
jgi:leucyl aminopeptidase